MKILYCPVCSSEVNRFVGKCKKCNTNIEPKESKYDFDYYKDESTKIYGHMGRMYDILNEREVFNNPYFNQDSYKIARDISSQETAQILNKMNNMNNFNIPKCPTCNSTKIKKISATKKVAHGLAFGLFSKTAFSQFECNNCGYKW